MHTEPPDPDGRRVILLDIDQEAMAEGTHKGNRDDIQDVLPESLTSVEGAAEWWDSHSAADDGESTTPVSMEFAAGGVAHVVARGADLAKKLAAVSERRGVSLETLVNLWLQVKLQTSYPHSTVMGSSAV